MLSNIQVIDLFAGPGGLGEGFSSILNKKNERVFDIKVSIEKDLYAHETLLLRAFFRQFKINEVPIEYYDYLKGSITKTDLFDKYPTEFKNAQAEALCIELGGPEYDRTKLNKIITKQLLSTKYKVLIGGPPCQAYSLMGRAVMMKKKGEDFEKDPRHTLYKEYLKVIADHKPHIFVMENVKGILSSKLKNQNIFPQILEDLRNPQKALTGKGGKVQYKIYSLVEEESQQQTETINYLIKSEKYGIPQSRHRVILLGVRSDIKEKPETLKELPTIKVEDVIGDLPKIRSGLSKSKKNDLKTWQSEIAKISHLKCWNKDSISTLIDISKTDLSQGASFIKCKSNPKYSSWYLDKKLGGIVDHISRNHMPEDLSRYFFASIYAQKNNSSPHLKDFPSSLLPKHKNAIATYKGLGSFSDRFKVQKKGFIASTILSHISKDGHYYIHYDPTQIRSLTVREAARIQTFPDNYKFEGPKTSQYQQVGNAVPPLLAKQIGEIVYRLLEKRYISNS